MRPLRLAFTDFWPGFNPRRNLFMDLLSTRYDVSLSSEPDLLIYSGFGRRHREIDAIRLFYCGEHWAPRWNWCDYAITTKYTDHPDHYRLPLYAYHQTDLLKGEAEIARLLAPKPGFCNFVYSNRSAQTRIRFFHMLSKYKRVDSGGGVLNNMGGRVGDKLAFLANYKFTIAFENASRRGYITEKLVEPMVAGSMPIYWGDPWVDRDFNTKSFVAFSDHGSLEALVERVIELDRNDDLYEAMAREPWLHNNQRKAEFEPAPVLQFLERVVETPRRPIGRTKLRVVRYGPLAKLIR